MSGVCRGGAYNSAIDRFRCAWRNGTRNKGYSDIELNGGFRLNGVIRPAYRIHQAYMYRCGMRYGYTSRNTVWNGYIGFRTV